MHEIVRATARHGIGFALVALSLTFALSVLLAFAQRAAAAGPSLLAEGLHISTGAIVDPDDSVWVADHNAGFCRIKPSTDGPGGIDHPQHPGEDVDHTCLGGLLPEAAAGPDAAGQPAFIDPSPEFESSGDEFVLIPDGASPSSDVVRADWNPDTGLFEFRDIIAMNADTGEDRPRPVAVSAAPDGNAYVVFQRSGTIQRIVDPESPTPTVDLVATTSDGRGASAVAATYGPGGRAVAAAHRRRRDDRPARGRRHRDRPGRAADDRRLGLRPSGRAARERPHVRDRRRGRRHRRPLRRHGRLASRRRGRRERRPRVPLAEQRPPDAGRGRPEHRRRLRPAPRPACSCSTTRRSSRRASRSAPAACSPSAPRGPASPAARRARRTTRRPPSPSPVRARASARSTAGARRRARRRSPRRSWPRAGTRSPSVPRACRCRRSAASRWTRPPRSPRRRSSARPPARSRPRGRTSSSTRPPATTRAPTSARSRR